MATIFFTWTVIRSMFLREQTIEVICDGDELTKSIVHSQLLFKINIDFLYFIFLHYDKKYITFFILYPGHDCLAKHLHRIGILQLPYCTLCKEQEDVDKTHIMKCSALRRSTEHERYWEARGLMSVYN